MKRLLGVAAIVGMLAGCSSLPEPPPASAPPAESTQPPRAAPRGGGQAWKPATAPGKGRWVEAAWSDLPGWGSDALHEAWNAWVRGCERPAPAWAAVCSDVRLLSLASAQEQQAWMMAALQPFRVEAAAGADEGLLTGYYEPLIEATRRPADGFRTALYSLPATVARGRPWFSRQEIDTLAQAQAALQGREIAYVAHPLDALALQIQGSGRLRVREADGSLRLVRLSYAGSNEQPYRSVGSWLLRQGEVRDASWPGIKAWADRNPGRLNELLWSNPRVVFFKEEPLGTFDAAFGPRGAQGVALTPGRSIAVDKSSIPYGTPVWLVSRGAFPLQRLVLAQDTGSAIVGAVRADYFVGWGDEAAEVAGRLKQPLQLWVLWPRGPAAASRPGAGLADLRP